MTQRRVAFAESSKVISAGDLAMGGVAESHYRSAAFVLAVLYGVGGAGCLLGARFPMSPHAPVGLDQMLAVVGLSVAIALFLTRGRAKPSAIHAALGLASVLVGVLVACSKTAAGVALTGVEYMCIGLVASYFLQRTAARVHVLLTVTGFTAGVIYGDVPRILVPWAVITGSVIAGAEVLGALVDQLRRQATTDSLTRLPNRAAFRTAADREIALAERSANPLSLALLDLDGFKAVNDNHGHQAGDALLVELTQAWQGQLRRGDLLARLGGDEFALLMPNTRPLEARRLLERLGAAHGAAWSAGVVMWNGDSDVDALLRRADHELYAAKALRNSSRSS